MPAKTWTVGEEVLAADFNAYVQRQVVSTFPNAAGRDAAIPAPVLGQVAITTDNMEEAAWNGVNWAPRAGAMIAFRRITAMQSGIGATVDLTNYSHTILTTAGRRYAFILKGEIVHTVADGAAVLDFTDAANTSSDRIVMAAVTNSVTLSHTIYVDGTGGSITRKLRLGKVLGTGTLSFGGAPNAPGIFAVQDVGRSILN